MPGGVVFEFKCTLGHKTERRFDPGTPYTDHAQILCPKCLEAGEAKDAYLIFACPEQGSKNGRPMP